MTINSSCDKSNFFNIGSIKIVSLNMGLGEDSSTLNFESC